MPEGDSLFRLAAKLRPALAGKEVLALELPRTELGVVERLRGRLVTDVVSQGKNLLIQFDDGSTLHTHLRMTGAWRLYDDAHPFRGAWTFVVAVLRVPGFAAVCFRAPTVRLLRPGAAARDPRLSSLGPDLLAPSFDLEEARRRLRARPSDPIGDVVMDQQAVAGIGNVYKSEVLFLRGLDPFAPVERLTDAELDGLLALARELLGKNVRREPRASRAWPYGEVRTTRTGGAPGRGPVNVYGRAGRPCFVCGTPISMDRQGRLRRSTYFCSTCQAVGGRAMGACPDLEG